MPDDTLRPATEAILLEIEATERSRERLWLALGNNLKLMRERSGKSLSELQREGAGSSANIGKLERGNPLSLPLARRVFNALTKGA